MRWRRKPEAPHSHTVEQLPQTVQIQGNPWWKNSRWLVGALVCQAVATGANLAAGHWGVGGFFAGMTLLYVWLLRKVLHSVQMYMTIRGHTGGIELVFEDGRTLANRLAGRIQLAKSLMGEDKDE